MSEIKDIAFSFQCKESWEKMNPCDGGKFCNVCQKTVYDFSNFSKEEYQDFLQSQTVPFCGNFRKAQTVKHINRFASFQKWAYGLLISLGFISCNDTRKARGIPRDNEQGVQVNLDTNIHVEPTTEPTVVGAICIAYPDTTIAPVNEEESRRGRLLPPLRNYKHGGDEGMMKFLQENIRLKDSVFGKVVVEYKVNKEGKVIDSKILKSLSPENDKEALRIVNLLEYEASDDSSTFNLPIIFGEE